MTGSGPEAHGREAAFGAAASASFLVFLATLPSSIAAMSIGCALCATLTVAAWLLNRRGGPAWPRTPVDLAGVAWFTALVLAALFAIDRAGSLPRVAKGLMPALVGLAAFHAADRRHGRRALAVYLAAAGVAAAIGLMAWVGAGASGAWRARGLSHHYMTYGGQLLLELPVALAVALTARSARWRWGAAAMALLAALSLAATFTRSAWLGAFVAGAVVVTALRPWGLTLLAAGAVAAWVFATGEWRDRIHSMVDPSHGYNGERLLMWGAGLRMFLDHPVTGVGLQDLQPLYETYRSPQARESAGHLHNSLVQIGATMGGLGLAAFAWLYATLVRTASSGFAWGRGFAARLRAQGLAGGVRLGVTAALAGFLVAGLFEWNFGDEELLYHLYTLVGIAWASRRWEESEREEPAPPPARGTQPGIGGGREARPGMDVPLARLTRRVPRFRGWHRLLEPLRRHFVKVYAGRPDRWIVIEDFEGDLRFRLDRAAYMSSVIYWRGIHSYSEARLIRRFLPHEGVFLDVGANQGELTLVAARRARRGRVIAFEPVAKWFELLAENVRLNGLDHVTTVNVAVSDVEAEIEMFGPSEGGPAAGFEALPAAHRWALRGHEGLSSFHRSSQRDVPLGRFPAVPLDLVVRREGLTRVDMIKIDVEGAELAVLEGARATLARFHPTTILELNQETFAAAGYAGADIARRLRSLGYALFEVDPFARISPVGDRPLAASGTLLARHETDL